jgi:glutamyl-tRNA synthetase
MNQENESITVRFAPSPTGFLHVGGARTAIFNWLFARKHGGEFLIRIEDTDIQRSDDAMVENILESMHWLGLSPDQEPVYQSENIENHKQAVRRLLGEDKAYRCFCTPEELEHKRKEAESTEGGYKYDRICLGLSNEDVREKLDRGEEYAIRFKVPGSWVNFKDRVYKKISVKNDEIDDFIIQRRDGTPVYQLAVVVDDASMGITHVIRGEDHLSNTPKQILLYQALDYDIPKFAHLPLILGGDGKRLSKRHGATSIEEYKNKGYLSTAVVNYLALLGWTPKSNEEIFMPEELVQEFDMLRVSKSSATFDEQKLEWVSGYHFSRWSTEDLAPLVVKKLQESGLIGEDYDAEYVHAVVDLLKTKVKTLYDFSLQGAYFWEEPTDFDEKPSKKYWNSEETGQLMGEWASRLKDISDFSRDNLEEELRNFADTKDVKAAELIHPTRLAITGTGVSPGIFSVMELIGKDRMIQRIQHAIEILPKDNRKQSG